MEKLTYHWRLIIWGVIVWTLFGVFFALQNYASAVYFGQQSPFGNTLAVWLICGYAWMFLTPLVIFLSEKFFISRSQIWRNLAVHFLAGAAISLLQLSAYMFIRQLLIGSLQKPFSYSTNFQRLFFTEFHANLLIYWIIVGIWHLRLINRRYLERERLTAQLALDTSQLETRLAQAQLDALKMQIHPHFLFNTLNSISVLMREGDGEHANQMLVRLSELLRTALKSERNQEVSLAEELEFLRSYLEIEQVRFQDRLEIAFEVEKEVLDAQVPNLILQPLVENAIRHGIAPLAEAGIIRIQAKRENGFVRISVSDNGAGFDELAKKSGGIGLKNTRERLKKLYGDRGRFEIISPESGGFEVRIRIPNHKK